MSEQRSKEQQIVKKKAKAYSNWIVLVSAIFTLGSGLLAFVLVKPNLPFRDAGIELAALALSITALEVSITALLQTRFLGGHKKEMLKWRLAEFYGRLLTESAFNPQTNLSERNESTST
jgi:hypothetical protein